MAKLSDIQIANMALNHLGTRSTIQQFTEDSTEAVNANLWFDFTRRQALAMFDWSFARRNVVLSLDEESAIDEIWTYRYNYPSDCIKARYLVNPVSKIEDAVPFEITMNSSGTEKTIMTDLENAELIYTFEQLNSELYTPWFALGMSYLLASHMALSITGKTSIKSAMFERAYGILVQAAAYDANEGIREAPRDADWVRGRT